jgi:hypothetical protein
MNHTVDELFLAASLDDTWQTPLAIKREFKILDCERPRAPSGWIEKREQPTDAHWRHGPVLNIEFYRRRQ